MHRDARRAWAQTLVGRTIAGRYRLSSLIDVGGMGAVFVARDPLADTDVAVKTLVPGALDDVQSERLRREAQRAAAVGGDGVVDVTDAGEDPVCGPFLVMEWLQGETLAARLEREGALPAPECVRIIGAVLRTLVEVHRQNLVHRDLKPENVFLARVDQEEVVKLLDFGVARPAHATGDTLTASGAVVGTPRYMAPEQARAEARIDARADLYAVGATLYTMLGGRRPFDELDAFEAVAATVAGPPQALSSLSASIPPALIAVVDRAMQTDREARFSDAEAMHAALYVALSAPNVRPDEDDTVTGATIPNRLPRERATGDTPRIDGSSRRVWPWAAAVAVAVALVAAVWTGRSHTPPVPSAPTSPSSAPPTPVAEPRPVERPAPAVALPPEPAPPVEPPPERERSTAPESPPRRRLSRPPAPRPRDPEGPGRTGALSPEDF